MSELLFIAMNIADETRHILEMYEKDITDGMNDNEIKAYYLGINNTIAAMKAGMNTENENELIINMECMEMPTEFCLDDLETYLTE